jgi:putative endonuclease
MYKVYVLKSESKNKIYIGHSDAFENRLTEHLSGESRSTKFTDDWKLIHQETFESRTLAMKREKFLKTGDGRKVLKLKGVA